MKVLLASIMVLTLAQATTPQAPSAIPRSSATVTDPAGGPTSSDAKERMDLAIKLNGLQGMDTPWHLKARYEILDTDGKTAEAGTYEEWRVSEKLYRIAIHSPSLSVEEFGTDHGVLRTGQQAWPMKPLSAIRWMIARPVAPPAFPEKKEYKNYERKFGSAKQPCTAVMIRGFHAAETDAESYCFATEGDALLYASMPNRTYETLFQKIVILHGHYLAKEIHLFILGRPWLTVNVDSIEVLAPAGMQALSVPADASPVTIRASATGEITNGHIVSRVTPAYPSAAKLQGVQGTVLLDGLIGTDGHLKQVQVLAGPPMLRQPALDAVRQWVYSPYLIDGQPMEVETNINVIFNLGG